MPEAPAGYRLLTDEDLTHPLPPRTLVAAYPFDHWEASLLVGHIIDDTVHSYAAPTNPAPPPTEDEINAIIPASFYAGRPPLERIAIMVHGWRAAISAVRTLEAECDDLRKKLAAQET